MRRQGFRRGRYVLREIAALVACLSTAAASAQSPWGAACGPAIPAPPAPCAPAYPAGGYAAPGYGDPYAAASCSAPYGAVAAGGYGGACSPDYGPALAYAPGAAWSVRAGALLLFRDDENHYRFSFDSAIESNQLLDARDAVDDFAPGVEVRVARLDPCAQVGWEGAYWGLFPADGMTAVRPSDVTGNLDAILNFDQLDYNGNPANTYVNDAEIHRLRRSSEIHNAELSRLWAPISPGACGCSPWSVRLTAGFRYFRVADDLEFAADANDAMLTGEADELYYAINAANNLYGLQLGGRFERRTAGRLSVICGMKAGAYANDASATSRIGGAAGVAEVNNGPNDGRAWMISANKCDAAFLGELHAGLAYELSCTWRLVGEYRVLGVSGLALPTNQIYHDLRGLQDVELLATNGSLLLHGAFAGLERRF